MILSRRKHMNGLERDVAAMAEALGLETDSKKRRKLLLRLQRKLSQLSAIEDHAISAKKASDGDYWRSRADRTRRLAAWHSDEHVRPHYLKIADGYLELAKRADDVQRASS
jgi:hypothetical protein